MEGQTLCQLGFQYKTEPEWDPLNVQSEKHTMLPGSTMCWHKLCAFSPTQTNPIIAKEN